ncbi:MAG: sialidase family protein [bacterium]
MRSVRLSAPVLLGLLLALAAVPALAQWGPVRQLTVTPENSILPPTGNGLAVMNDNVHIVFADRISSVRQVLYLRSNDGGENFQPYVSVEPQSGNYNFSIAADSAGNVHLINARSAGGLWYRRSTDNGVNWADAVELRESAQKPVLLVTGRSGIHVVDVGADNNFYILSSTDGGATWGGWRAAFSAQGFDGFSVAATGSLFNAAYAYGGMGSAQTYAARSTDGGQNWLPEEQLSATPQTVPVGIWNDGVNVWLSFTIFGASRNFRRSSDGGATWQSEQTLRTVIRSIARAGANIGAVALQEDNRVLFLTSANAGGTWSDTVNISGAQSAARAAPRLAVDATGRAHAVWTSRETGNVEVFYRVGTGVIGVEEERAPVARPAAARLAPNPARSAVRLAGSTPVRLYNRAGVSVAELRPGANDVSRLARGVYFARTAEGADAGKLVKLD